MLFDIQHEKTFILIVPFNLFGHWLAISIYANFSEDVNLVNVNLHDSFGIFGFKTDQTNRVKVAGRYHIRGLVSGNNPQWIAIVQQFVDSIMSLIYLNPHFSRDTRIKYTYTTENYQQHDVVGLCSLFMIFSGWQFSTNPILHTASADEAMIDILQVSHANEEMNWSIFENKSGIMHIAKNFEETCKLFRDKAKFIYKELGFTLPAKQRRKRNSTRKLRQSRRKRKSISNSRRSRRRR